MSSYDYKILCVDGSTALCHHGIKGMKWGVRRYQNADGSLTPEGIKRYRRKFKKMFEQAEKVYYSKEDGDLSGWSNAVGKMKKRGLSDRAVEDVAGAYLGGSLGEVLKSANAGIEKGAQFVASSTEANMTAARTHQNIMQQIQAQNFVNQQIAFSNQLASLSMTNGTNPYMF